MPDMGGTRGKDRTGWNELKRASCGLPINQEASPAANTITADDRSCGGEPEVACLGGGVGGGRTDYGLLNGGGVLAWSSFVLYPTEMGLCSGFGEF
jgi:hypothetical protein